LCVARIYRVATLFYKVPLLSRLEKETDRDNEFVYLPPQECVVLTSNNSFAINSEKKMFIISYRLYRKKKKIVWN
jgi:hypothetical protein